MTIEERAGLESLKAYGRLSPAFVDGYECAYLYVMKWLGSNLFRNANGEIGGDLIADELRKSMEI